jgi:phosphoribosylglycinamide formyltransferase 1
MTLRLAVLISGRGSNLAAVLRAIDAGQCDAEVSLVVSDRAAAAGLALATQRGIRSAVVALRDHASREAWNDALAQRVAEAEPELVVLAGFMRVVGPAFLARFPNRVINVHPALLPLFPGTDGPAQAIAAGMRISGCTVHLVDAGVDTGPILAQGAVRVLTGDSEAMLHERIQRVEHRLLPEVIHAIARREIRLDAPLEINAGHDDQAALYSPMFRSARASARTSPDDEL